MTDPVQLIRDAEFGTRMTVRTRIPTGFTDALGYLRKRTELACVIETRRGMVSVLLSEVTAAKVVPPPPARRAPRYPGL